MGLLDSMLAELETVQRQVQRLAVAMPQFQWMTDSEFERLTLRTPDLVQFGLMQDGAILYYNPELLEIRSLDLEEAMAENGYHQVAEALEAVLGDLMFKAIIGGFDVAKAYASVNS